MFPVDVHALCCLFGLFTCVCTWECDTITLCVTLSSASRFQTIDVNGQTKKMQSRPSAMLVVALPAVGGEVASKWSCTTTASSGSH